MMNKIKYVFLVFAVLQCSFVMASSVPLDSDMAEIAFTLDDSSFYYKIGFTRSEEEPDVNTITDAYSLKVGKDGKGHDTGDLFVYWEITGRNFIIELTSGQLVSSSGNLDVSVSWPGKKENSNTILESENVYSGRQTLPLSITTASVTEAAIDNYFGELTLMIRRI